MLLSLFLQPKTIEEAILRLLKNRKFCDVIFTFPNLPDQIEAHELFLSARSSVFREIFQNWRSRVLRMIEITEATPERFQEFLEVT